MEDRHGFQVLNTGASRPINASVDADLRHRARSVRASFLPTLALSVIGWIYVALTWDEPNRAPIAWIFGIVALSTLALSRLPMERIVASDRWREPFFVSWSVSVIALIATAVAPDGGTTSPSTPV